MAVADEIVEVGIRKGDDEFEWLSVVARQLLPRVHRHSNKASAATLGRLYRDRLRGRPTDRQIGLALDWAVQVGRMSFVIKKDLAPPHKLSRIYSVTPLGAYDMAGDPEVIILVTNTK